MNNFTHIGRFALHDLDYFDPEANFWVPQHMANPVPQRTETDCFRACVESITGVVGLPNLYDLVPEWAHRNPSKEAIAVLEAADEKFKAALAEIGWGLFDFSIYGNKHNPMTAQEALEFTAELLGNVVCIVNGGYDGTEVNHAVVCRNGVVIHDPAYPTEANYTAFDAPCWGIEDGVSKRLDSYLVQLVYKIGE